VVTSTDALNVRAETRSRTQARQEAARAMQRAARSLAIEPLGLSATAYRSFRAAQDEAQLPSPLAIRLLFLGWQRACEHVAVLICDDAHVEADVARKLYGDPSCRQRAHGTSGHLPRAQVGDVIPQPGRLVRGAAVSGAAHANCAPIHDLKSDGRAGA
jgi:hypothetical protein